MGRGPVLWRLAPLPVVRQAYAGLAGLSACCPPPQGRFPRVPQPCATHAAFAARVRLACIRHAASVRPEPGSNSSLCGWRRLVFQARAPHQGRTIVTCASTRFSCEGTSAEREATTANKKPGGQALRQARATWRRLWSDDQRVSRKERAGVASCCVYRFGGETTAKNNVPEYTTKIRSCQT